MFQNFITCKCQHKYTPDFSHSYTNTLLPCGGLTATFRTPSATLPIMPVSSYLVNSHIVNSHFVNFTLSILILWTSHFVNSHFVNIDQMGIDQIGIDKVRSISNTNFLAVDFPLCQLLTSSTSHFVNSNLVNSRLVNVDKVGIDEVRSWQNENWQSEIDKVGNDDVGVDKMGNKPLCQHYALCYCSPKKMLKIMLGQSAQTYHVHRGGNAQNNHIQIRSYAIMHMTMLF